MKSALFADINKRKQKPEEASTAAAAISIPADPDSPDLTELQRQADELDLSLQTPISEETQQHLKQTIIPFFKSWIIAIQNKLRNDEIEEPEKFLILQKKLYKKFFFSTESETALKKDPGFNPRDRMAIFTCAEQVISLISNVLLKKANLISVSDNSIKTNLLKAIEKDITQIGEINADLDSTIKKMVNRRIFSAQTEATQETLYDVLMQEVQEEEISKLAGQQEQGDFETADAEKYSREDLIRLQKKISKLNAEDASMFLAQALQLQNIPLAYKLFPIVLGQDTLTEEAYLNLIASGIAAIARFPAEDERVKFFKSKFNEIVNGLELDALMSAKERIKSAIVTDFASINAQEEKILRAKNTLLDGFLRSIDSRINETPTIEASSSKLVKKIKASTLDFGVQKEECIKIFALNKELEKSHRICLKRDYSAAELYKYFYLNSIGRLISYNDLQVEANKFMQSCRKSINAQTFQVEEATDIRREPRDAEHIKAEIIETFKLLGLKEDELSIDNLFEETRKQVASVDNSIHLNRRDILIGGGSTGAKDSTEYSLPTGERRATGTTPASRTVVESPVVYNRSNALSNPLAKQAKSKNPFDKLDTTLIDITKINGIDRDGNSFLHILCENNEADAASIIKSINYLCDWMGKRTYTHQTTGTDGLTTESNGNAAIIEFLNQRNAHGETALHLLCKNKHYRNTDLMLLISELYLQGADLNIPDKDNIIPLQMLCGRGESLEAVKYLCGEAIRDELDNIISQVEEKDRAEINYQDTSAGKSGFTPIYTAALGNLSRGINSLSRVYEYLKDKGAKLDLAQTCNPDIPGTVAEYIQEKMKSYGVSSAASLSETIHNKIKEIQLYIDTGNLTDLENAILLNKDLLKLTDIEGDGFLDYAARKGNQEIINLLLENHPMILEFRAELENTKSSLSAGILAGGLGLVATCTYFAASMPQNAGEAVAASIVSLGTSAASGAVIWGIGRLCYEGYHQFSSYGDANISQKFTVAMQNLKNIESADTNDVPLECLTLLEEAIIAETKMPNPNIKKMGEDLIKCHLLRESLFKRSENKESIIEASKQLIENFESWRKIQEGRETSRGLKLFYDAVRSSTIGVIVGSATAALTQNLPVSGFIGAGATAAFAGKMWKDRIQTSENKYTGKQ